jgi:serine/threonine protein kinase
MVSIVTPTKSHEHNITYYILFIFFLYLNKHEILIEEKVDVYSLGNIIYILLTGHSPRGPTKQDRKAHIQQQVLNGVAPALDRFPNVFYSTSEDPRIVAMKQALNECYQPDPTKRSSSRDIANILIKAIVEI